MSSLSRFLLAFGLLLVIFTTAQARNEVSNPERETSVAAHFFLGGELLAMADEGPFPISKLTENNIYIRENRIERTLDLNTRIGLKTIPVVSFDFLEIEGLEYQFQNLTAGMEEVRMLSELSYSQSMSEGEIGDVRSINPNIQDDDLLNQEQVFRKQMERQIDDLRTLEDGWVDTINITFNITPHQDLVDLYVVFGLAFGGAEDASNNDTRDSSLLVHYLGNFHQGESQAVQFSKAVERIQVSQSECELFFFQGEAEPVAHNLAKNLRPLSKQEAEEVQAYLRQVLSN